MPALENKRHEKFCQNIAKGLSQTEAYEKAGYKSKGKTAGNHASRLVENGSIKSRIAELSEKVESKAIADAAEIQEFWTAVMRGQGKEVRVFGKDPKKFKLKPQFSDRIKAAEALARAKGMFLKDNDDGGEYDEWLKQLEEANELYGPN